MRSQWASQARDFSRCRALPLPPQGPATSGAQKDHLDILVPRPNTRGMPEILVCRILLFIRSFGPLCVGYPYPLKCHLPWHFGRAQLSGALVLQPCEVCEGAVRGPSTNGLRTLSFYIPLSTKTVIFLGYL